MTTIPIENLIEINLSKENRYQLCDYLATKLINNSYWKMKWKYIISNEFDHKYVQNSQWNLNKIWSENKEFVLISEASCVTIDDNQQIICFSRTDNPTRLAIWSREENSFQLFDNQQENNILFSRNWSCINEIICFVVNQDEILCQINFICSK